MHFSLLTALHESGKNMYFLLLDILSCGVLSCGINLSRLSYFKLALVELTSIEKQFTHLRV